MKKNIIFLVFLVFSVFILISSVSAANFYVNNGTTDKNINDWINKTAKTGDNLIFNTQSYDLTDRLNISKSINIKSYKNTQINFNKPDFMFFITAKKSTISGLTLNHNFEELQFFRIDTISGGNDIDIKNTIINTNGPWSSCISLYGKGNIINSTLNSKSRGIDIVKWNGNLSNLKINAKDEGISESEYKEYGRTYWYGNLINTSISSGKDGIHLQEWKGKIINSKIYTNGSKSNGINIKYSKGTISKTVVTSKNAYAAKIPNDVKIASSSFSSKKGLSIVYRYLTDLKISRATLSLDKSYHITVVNSGYSPSKSSYLVIKAGKVTKKVPIKSLEPYIPFAKTKYKITVKITLPKKYISEKYLKIVKIDYYNKNKEINKKNNIKKFRFEYFPIT